MRLFVTGGAGFIGSNYVRRLLATSDDEVVIFDVLTYAGHLSTIADLVEDPRVSFVRGDITDRAAVASAEGTHGVRVHVSSTCKRFRSVMKSSTHTAWCSMNTRSEARSRTAA